MHKSRAQFDTARLADDMAGRGWLAVDLARRAGVSHMTVGRFLSGESQTARTAMKLALALGRPLSRYLIKGATKRSERPGSAVSPEETEAR